MDASTLFYLSKIANTMANNANEPIVNYDPTVLNSMAETYLRRFYTDSLGLANTGVSGSSSDAFKSLNNSIASNSPINSSSTSVSPTLLSPNMTHRTNKHGSITTTSPASSQSSSSSSSSSTKSSNRSNYEYSNGDLLKTLSNQSTHQNGSKFLIADILGLSGKVGPVSLKSPINSNQVRSNTKSLNPYTSEAMGKKRPHSNSSRPVDSSLSATSANIQDFQSQLANSFILNKIISPQSNSKSHNQSQLDFPSKTKHANELNKMFHQNNTKNIHETFFGQQNLNVNNISSTPLKLPCQNNQKLHANKTPFSRADIFDKNNDDGNESIYDDDQDLDSDQG